MPDPCMARRKPVHDRALPLPLLPYRPRMIGRPWPREAGRADTELLTAAFRGQEVRQKERTESSFLVAYPGDSPRRNHSPTRCISPELLTLGDKLDLIAQMNTAWTADHFLPRIMPDEALVWLVGHLSGEPHKDNTAKRAPIPTRPAHRNRPSDALLTITDVADRLRISTKQVRKLVDDGLLRYINIGRGSKHRAMRFTPADVEACITQLAKRNVPSCLSTRSKSRRTTTWTSSGEVIGFTARRSARAEGRRNK